MGRDNLDWRLNGKCCSLESKQYDEYFFPRSGRVSFKSKQFCSDCPMVSKCLSFALEHHPVQGVWAGTTEKEREKMVDFTNHVSQQPKLKTVSFSFS